MRWGRLWLDRGSKLGERPQLGDPGTGCESPADHLRVVKVPLARSQDKHPDTASGGYEPHGFQDANGLPDHRPRHSVLPLDILDLHDRAGCELLPADRKAEMLEHLSVKTAAHHRRPRSSSACLGFLRVVAHPQMIREDAEDLHKYALCEYGRYLTSSLKRRCAARLRPAFPRSEDRRSGTRQGDLDNEKELAPSPTSARPMVTAPPLSNRCDRSW